MNAKKKSMDVLGVLMLVVQDLINIHSGSGFVVTV